MNQAIKAQWLAALRSGAYKQTTGMLRKDNGYCCLGVLCDLASKTGIGTWSGLGRFEVPYFIADDGRSIDLLPHAIVAWAGLNACDPSINGGSLSEYNDGTSKVGREHTFAEIADLIEAHL